MGEVIEMRPGRHVLFEVVDASGETAWIRFESERHFFRYLGGEKFNVCPCPEKAQTYVATQK